MGIEQWKAAWEFFRFSNHAETSRSEQVGQISASLTVDGDAERRQSHASGFKDGHSRVFNAIAGIVKVEIIRLAVGDDQQESATGGLFVKDIGGLADCGTHAGVETRLDGQDASASGGVVVPVEILEQVKANVLPA